MKRTTYGRVNSSAHHRYYYLFEMCGSDNKPNKKKTMRLSPLEIVNRMINTEEELKHFIKQNCIHAPGDCHLYG